MPARIRPIAFVAAAMMLLAAACGPGSAAKPTPQRSPFEGAITAVQTATPAPGSTPATPTRPGVASVDAAIDAATSGSIDGIVKFRIDSVVKFRKVACASHPSGFGAPPACAPGERDGQPVDVIPVADCDASSYLRPDAWFGTVARFESMHLDLYGVFRQPNGAWPPDRWVVVLAARLTPQDAPLARALTVGADGAAALVFPCDQSPAHFVQSQHLGSALLLAPAPTPPPAPLAPPPPRTGILSVDAALAAVAARDAPALLGQVRYEKQPCITDPQGLDAQPVCRAGESTGKLVDVLQTASCEGFPARPDQVPAALAGFLRPELSLFGVYHVGSAATPRARYALVFAFPAYGNAGPQLFADTLFLDDSGIVGQATGCSAPPSRDGFGAAIPLTR